MIIDLILDRKDGKPYSPKKFYDEVMAYGKTWPKMAYPIADAMDVGTEKQVKLALEKYITDNEYNPSIIDYINSVNWIIE
jgi:hypothetical protein